ncbi:MAG: hypothetical protein U1E47_09735 [Rivihabitans pingtungensis]
MIHAAHAGGDEAAAVVGKIVTGSPLLASAQVVNNVGGRDGGEPSELFLLWHFGGRLMKRCGCTTIMA